MSRLPQPSSSSSPGVRTRLKSTPSAPTLRSPVTPLAKPRAKTPNTAAAAPTSSPLAKPRAKTPGLAATPNPTLRTQPSLKHLKAISPNKSPVKKTPLEDAPPPSPKPQLSIRDQIALKRAEAKKAAVKTSPVQEGFAGLEDASPHTYDQQPAHDVEFGRWSIKETIERARSSGAINLSSRDLLCIPSALYEIHLGITPVPLKSVPVEPPITTFSSGDSAPRRKGNAPSWYEAQDLEVLKAWSNEIVEIQPEISMFGSLKTIDLHSNKLAGLPDTFADLTALTHVDLSHNELTSLPSNFWALPHLATLNLSHNSFIALPFSVPFKCGSNPHGRTKDSRGGWFSQSITRATEPLPRLTSLDVSYNHLPAVAIDHPLDGPGLPLSLSKLDLSGNPLGKCDTLFRALGKLHRLSELHMRRADVGDDSFPVSIFAASPGVLFPKLTILDLEETHVTQPVIEAVFISNAVNQSIEFDVTSQEPPDGVLQVVVGKRVVKEPWEIEAERRTRQRRAAFAESVTTATSFGRSQPAAARKEAWEIEAERGLVSEGAKWRAPAMAAARSSAPAQQPTSSSLQDIVIEKEAWEIEAEQGLLSAGVRRRLRAAAALAAADKPNNSGSGPLDASHTPSPQVSGSSPSTLPTAAALANPQYYNAPARTLTLPTSAPPSKSTHARSFSLAAQTWSKGLTAAVSELALAIPAPTLPLAAIAAQPLAHTLKVLVLTGRRADPSFSLPVPTDAAVCAWLPCLEELSLENCNLGGAVPVSQDGDGPGTPRASEPLLPLLARLFPSVRTLDLSYNALTSAALTQDALATLVFADADGSAEGGGDGDGIGTRIGLRKGLRQLRLRGNRLNELGGFQEIAERFKGNRNVPEWKLEELDLRDNEIGKLPAELGLLPLDVFLVDGNVFRVPPRRVWEREGTKGLLGWLRGRME